MGTHYHTLCISPRATEEEIRQAYRSLLLAVHPDKQVSHGLVGGVGMNRISAIQEAYSVLKDPESRALYDSEIRSKQAYQEVYDRIQVSDMEISDNNDTILRYPCRCGDVFEVENTLLSDNGNHEYILDCSSCSLSLVLSVQKQ